MEAKTVSLQYTADNKKTLNFNNAVTTAVK